MRKPIMKKGYFITFEGNDGSGKTTISKKVYEQLCKDGIDAIYTREPGGIEIAEQIRNIILNPKNTQMDARTEALLYAASRRQHLIEKVIPAIETGKVVICDRFVDSSLAYQGFGRELGMEEVYEMNQFAIEGHMPDKTIFLQLTPEQGLARIENRDFKDRLDQEDLSFHKRVAEGYAAVLETYRDRMIVIDASKNIDEVFASAYQEVLHLVK